MKRLAAVLGLLLFISVAAPSAHDPGSAPITWNREMSRIVYERCASCHRQGGSAFSLTTYKDAQPRASAIKEAVLSRRMPPWGAVKGFGNFRNDRGLTQQQISLVSDWVEGGTVRGNNPNALPPLPESDQVVPYNVPTNTITATEGMILARDVTVEGVYPKHVQRAASMQIVGSRPNGGVEPLVWLYEYQDRYPHPFEFRRPLQLPAGTVIRGIRDDATILLIVTAGTKR